MIGFSASAHMWMNLTVAVDELDLPDVPVKNRRRNTGDNVPVVNDTITRCFVFLAENGISDPGRSERVNGLGLFVPIAGEGCLGGPVAVPGHPYRAAASPNTFEICVKICPNVIQ